MQKTTLGKFKKWAMRPGLTYSIWTILIGTATTLRGLWSWPDVTWLSALWDIRSIDSFMNLDFAAVAWFQVGGGQITNGYRWFQYLNASVFGLNSQVEIIVYGILLIFVCLAIGRSIRAAVGPEHSSANWSFFVPPVLFSLVGGWPRGMELGTFSGLALAVIALIYISKISSFPRVLALAFGLGLVEHFVFMGGYALGLTLGTLMILFVYRKNHHLRARLSALALGFGASSGLQSLTLFQARNPEVDSSLGSLLNQIAIDPFFALKFVSNGPASSLITLQSLERFDARVTPYLTLAVSVLVVSFSYLVVKGAKSNLMEATKIAPLILIAYSVSNFVMLLLFRPNSEFQLLNTWYSLHGKIGLVGVIWLGAISLGRETKRVRAGIYSVGVILSIIFVAANVYQFQRNVSEREYFKEIAIYTLFPKENPYSGPVTPLQLSERDSKEAIRILKDHNLGVFRSTERTLSEVSDGNPYVFTGNAWADGWVGPKFEVKLLSECKNPKITLTKHPMLGEGKLTVSGAGRVQEYRFDESSLSLNLGLFSRTNEVSFSSGSYINEFKVGVGVDDRDLFAKANLSC